MFATEHLSINTLSLIIVQYKINIPKWFLRPFS